MSKSEELADGLRQLATLVEGMKLPAYGVYAHVSVIAVKADEFRALARAVGTFEKNGDEHYYRIVRKFPGDVDITITIDRGKICRKVRVMKEVDAYECDDSLLDPTPEAVTA